jgi:hypothetical protein
VKKLAPICLFIAVLAGLAFAWLHFRSGLVVVQTYESGGKTWTVTTRIKGDRVRKDGFGGTSFILDLAGGSATIISNPEDTFAKLPLGQMVANAKTSFGGDAASPTGPPELADTGKMEKVAGYNAEIYTADSPAARFTCWIAKDYPEYAALNERWKKYRLLEKTGGLYPDLSKLDGMVVKSEIEFHAGKTTTTTLVSARIEPVDDSEFQPPAGYMEVQQQEAPAPDDAPPNR